MPPAGFPDQEAAFLAVAGTIGHTPWLLAVLAAVAVLGALALGLANRHRPAAEES